LNVSYRGLIQSSIGNIQSLGDFSQNALKEYTNKNKFSIEKFWLINSKSKIIEEISNLLTQSQNEVIIIVPEIKNFLSLEDLKHIPEELKIKIASSESHNDNFIKEITKVVNIEYKRLKNDNFIGLYGDNSYIVLGAIQSSEKNPLKNIIGFGTSNLPLIDSLLPLILKNWKKGRLPKEVQVQVGFNQIIENINTIKGKKIGSILQNILKVEFKAEKMDLDLLALKLLTGKLIKINEPINDNMKRNVLEKINLVNKQFSKLDLKVAPILAASSKEEEIINDYKPGFLQQETPEISQAIQQEVPKPSITPQPETQPKEPPKEEEVTSDKPQIDNIFDEIFFKIDELKGFEIGRKLQDFMDDILETQGYSSELKDMKQWISKLRIIRKPLEESIMGKLLPELNKWKGKYIKKVPGELKTEDLPDFAKMNVIKEASTIESPKETNPELMEKLKMLQKNSNELKGDQLSSQLQDIADILLMSHGAVALGEIRQRISKLRAIKEPLDFNVKTRFQMEIDKWKEKFC